MSQKIDISTHVLGELTEKAMGGKVSVETILTAWHEIGSTIKDQLLQRKGVRLTSFGAFSFNSRNEPVFLMAQEFGNQFKLKQRGQPTGSTNIAVSAVNFTAVKQKTNIPREVIEKIYAKFMTCLGRSIFEGRGILLTIHRVAEISINQGELNCNFMPDFISLFVNAPNPVKDIRQFRKIAQNTSSNIATDHFFEELDQGLPVHSGSRTGLAIGRDEPPERRGKARPQSAGRSRNPITGSEHSFPNGNARRPSSAQQQQSGQRSISTPRARPASAGADRFDRLKSARQQQNIADQTDPRRLAAKAAMNVNDVVNKVRQRIVERGGSNGIRSISKLLAIMDDNGDKRLSRDELRYGLRDYGIDLTPTELEQVFVYFDRDGNGFIDVTEFLVGIRGEMNDRRRSMVQMAFNVLDKDRSGVVDAEEILAVYDLTWHPEVRAGRMSVQEAAKNFMSTWDRGDKDGLVTLEEFEDYYKEISASIDDDDYFELMIRNAWRIAGGSGAAANTANKRVLVTNKDGSQSVQTVQNELGMKGRDVEDVRRRLAQQGIEGDVALYGGYDDVKDGRGARPGFQQPHRGDGGAAVGGRPSNPGTNSRRQQQPQAGRKEAWVEQRNVNADGTRGGRGYDMLSMQPPGPGDQNLPGEYSESYSYNNRNSRPTDRPASSSNGNAYGNGRPSSSNYGNGNQGGFDAYDTLHRLLYKPAVDLEGLCIKLAVSASAYSPRVAQGAFVKRLQTLDSSLTKEQLLTLWRVVDSKNIGSIEVQSIHDLLINRFGKDKTAGRNASVIDRVRAKILERCGQNAGIKGLARTLMIMDDSGDKKLSKQELKNGLQDYGIELNIRELDEVFSYFDRDKSGTIDIDELLVGIRGELNERRQGMVNLVFNMLDRDGSGEITIDEMLDRFDFTQHPEVQNGSKTPREAMKEFIRKWDRADGDGIVTVEEFNDYYKEISASIDGDDYFELMIRNAWRIAGGSGAAANTANKRVLVTNKDGSQSVQTVQNELGMKGRDVEDVRRRLAQQGIEGDVALYGGYQDKVNQPSKSMNKGLSDRLQNHGGPQHRSSSNYNNNNNYNLNKTAPAATKSAAAAFNNARSSYQDNKNSSHKSQTGGSRSNHNQTAPVAPLFERHAAAAKLAAAFRGRMGRKQAEQEKRKVEAERQQQYEAEQEANRPRPRDISRPKGRSYIGF